MKAEELAKYAVGHALDGDRCCLCVQAFKPAEEILLVPEDCEQTAKMHAGEPYMHRPAHRACMERVP